MRILFRVAIAYLLANQTSFAAEDYRILVENQECQLQSGEKTKDTVVHAVELRIRPNETFRTKVVLGEDAVVVSGRMTKNPVGGFKVAIRYRRSKKQNEMPPIVTLTSTTVAVDVGKPQLVGEIHIKNPSSNENTLEANESRTRIMLTLTENDSETEVFEDEP